jgi:hypothetical protein
MTDAAPSADLPTEPAPPAEPDAAPDTEPETDDTRTARQRILDHRGLGG